MNKIVIDKNNKKDIIEAVDRKKHIVYRGNACEMKKFLNNPKKYDINYIAKNTFIDLLDYKEIDARIEPGAVIRTNVKIGKNAIILSGSIINVNANIGNETMIDMGAVIGSGAIIGRRCHIGAGAVISGVMEPASNNPVVVEDDVFIGAGAVILPSIKIGSNAVIGAGSVVTKDVETRTTVVGNPARFLKKTDDLDQGKIEINVNLR